MIDCGQNLLYVVFWTLQKFLELRTSKKKSVFLWGTRAEDSSNAHKCITARIFVKSFPAG